MVEQSSFCPDKLLIAIGAFIVLSSILLFSKANDIFKSFFVIASAFLILAENIQFPSFLWHNSTSFIDDKYIHYYIRTSIYTFRCLRQFVFKGFYLLLRRSGEMRKTKKYIRIFINNIAFLFNGD